MFAKPFAPPKLCFLQLNYCRIVLSQLLKASMHPNKRSISSQTAISRAKRAKTTNANANGTIENTATPLRALLEAMSSHQDTVPPKTGNVVHWFRSDLRLQDNRALHLASQKALENKKGLIALYIISPQVSPLIFFLQ
jgi:DNA photolyase